MNVMVKVWLSVIHATEEVKSNDQVSQGGRGMSDTRLIKILIAIIFLLIGVTVSQRIHINKMGRQFVELVDVLRETNKTIRETNKITRSVIRIFGDVEVGE